MSKTDFNDYYNKIEQQLIMKKLAPDYQISRYGLDCRLVNEDDVDFILSLRTNKELSQHLHQTENDREQQILWLKDYKKREEEGREYYFIFYYQGEPVGLNRMSSRSELYAVSGSWLCKPGIAPWIPITINLLFNDIVFEELKIQLVVCDVRKLNGKVNKYHRMLGDVKVHESEIDNFYYRTKETFMPNRDKIVRLFNLKK